jgi:predicted DNA-binding transcriptional regulator YafY
MSNFHRLIWIDAQLRAGRFPNATQIAKAFEISRRQAARDLEYMRHSLGAPIQFCSERNGYGYSHRNFALPAVFVSDAERAALLEGDAEQRAAADVQQRVVSRFLAQLSPPGMLAELRFAVPPGLRANAQQTRERLQRAIDQRFVVVLRGSNPARPFSVHRLHPYRFGFTRGFVDAYVIGFSETENTVCPFHLAFIDEVELTTRHFQDVHPESPEVLRFRRPYMAEVEIARTALPESLRAAARFASDERCSLEFLAADELLGALLQRPEPFRIVSPRWLIARLRTRLERILAQNVAP